MGEVYRARDIRLDRTVAIKVLPPGLTGNAERRARFEREARTLASLSHPRICALFDVGEHEGSTFLVMEHLQGETLADRIFRGPLPLTQALEIAVQIAEGLDAAHKRGIVHRDLKPGNAMLTKSGATLLDFGLAKLRSHGERPALTLHGNSATESESFTKEGVILGTLQYMAPEQIQGREADARADLWALGAILYEMVSGKRPFTGDNPASLMGAILERDPPSLSTGLPVAPPSLDRVLRRCLAKSPDERWESARDLADQLRWIAQDVERGELPATKTGAGPHWRLSLPMVAVALAGLVAGAVALSILRPATAPARQHVVRSLLDISPASEVRSGLLTPSQDPTPGGSRTVFAWAPDGQALVFAGQKDGSEQLFVRELSGGAARPLPGTKGAQAPVVSADGQWVAFWADGAIRKVPFAGGPSAVIADEKNIPTGMDWGASGLLVYDIYQPGGWAIWQVRAGSKPEAVTTPEKGELMHLMPKLLPGDTAALFTVRPRGWTSGDEEVVAQVLASGERKVLLHDATDARFLPPRHLVFMRQGTLYAVPFDASRLEVKGEPVAMLEGVAQSTNSGFAYVETGAGEFAVSPAGDLAYIASPLVPFQEYRLVTVGRTGRVEPLPAPARSYFPPTRVSPGGRQLAVTIRSLTELGIWIYDLTRQTLTKLTPPGGEFSCPLWTPDERRIAFLSLQSGVATLAWQGAEGSAPPELLVNGAAMPGSWTPDGRELAVVKDGGIWALDVTLEPPKLLPLVQLPVVQSSGTAWAPEFSPDGRWLLFQAGFESDQVYLQPYPGPGLRLQVSGGSGFSPAWNPNGREIFFVAESKTQKRFRMMSVDVTLGANATLGAPRELFEFDPEELLLDCGAVLPCYSVSPDGQRFFTMERIKADLPPPVTQIHLIQNWTAELEAKVPSGL